MLPLIIVMESVVFRLMPHPPNFAPISAIAIFGGVYLNKKWVLLLPLLSMVISDYLLLYVDPQSYPFIDVSHVYPLHTMFHSTTLFVYCSFVVSGLIGLMLRKKIQDGFIVPAILATSLQFFIITNFGVWLGGMYSRGIDGLLQSYVMGLPFLKWTLLGDFFYTFLLFGIYEARSYALILLSFFRKGMDFPRIVKIIAFYEKLP